MVALLRLPGRSSCPVELADEKQVKAAAVKLELRRARPTQQAGQHTAAAHYDSAVTSITPLLLLSVDPEIEHVEPLQQALLQPAEITEPARSVGICTWEASPRTNMVMSFLGSSRHPTLDSAFAACEPDASCGGVVFSESLPSGLQYETRAPPTAAHPLTSFQSDTWVKSGCRARRADSEANKAAPTSKPMLRSSSAARCGTLCKLEIQKEIAALQLEADAILPQTPTPTPSPTTTTQPKQAEATPPMNKTHAASIVETLIHDQATGATARRVIEEMSDRDRLAGGLLDTRVIYDVVECALLHRQFKRAHATCANAMPSITATSPRKSACDLPAGLAGALNSTSACAIVTVRAKDAWGTPMATGGDTLFATLIAKGVEPNSIRRSAARAHPLVFDQCNGVYSVLVRPPAMGRFELYIDFAYVNGMGLARNVYATPDEQEVMVSDWKAVYGYNPWVTTHPMTPVPLLWGPQPRALTRGVAVPGSPFTLIVSGEGSSSSSSQTRETLRSVRAKLPLCSPDAGPLSSASLVADALVSGSTTGTIPFPTFTSIPHSCRHVRPTSWTKGWKQAKETNTSNIPDLNKCYEGKRILFIGDSTTRETMVDLIRLLEGPDGHDPIQSNDPTVSGQLDGSAHCHVSIAQRVPLALLDEDVLAQMNKQTPTKITCAKFLPTSFNEPVDGGEVRLFFEDIPRPELRGGPINDNPWSGTVFEGTYDRTEQWEDLLEHAVPFMDGVVVGWGIHDMFYLGNTNSAMKAMPPILAAIESALHEPRRFNKLVPANGNYAKRKLIVKETNALTRGQGGLKKFPSHTSAPTCS